MIYNNYLFFLDLKYTALGSKLSDELDFNIINITGPHLDKTEKCFTFWPHASQSKSNMIIDDNGFKYTLVSYEYVQNSKMAGISKWRCTNRKYRCKAYIVIKNLNTPYMSYEWVGEHSHPSKNVNSDIFEFIMDLKREAGTDLLSDPMVILSKIYASSVLAKYSSSKYQNCPQIKHLLQIIRRTRAQNSVAFPSMKSISCNIDTSLFPPDFYIGQVNTSSNGRHTFRYIYTIEHFD